MERSSREKAYLLLAWVFVVAILAFYAVRIGRIGWDLRQDFWVYWNPNHFPGDMNQALSHGNDVLRDADAIAQQDEALKTPAQRQYEMEHPPATIAQPGQGLFESPFNLKIFRERWTRLRPVYGQILRGWVARYENLWRDVGEGGDFDMDYPPLRLLVMTLWTWNVQSNYPGITSYPRQPQRVFDSARNTSVVATSDIVQPMLRANATCESISAISIFILVWLWMSKRKPAELAVVCNPSGVFTWKDRWGDPMLLAPLILFGVCAFFRSNVTWSMPLPDGYQQSPIDARVASVGWWVFLLLRFLAAVCLARFLPRPFRAPMCALVAATLAWMNPASILDSFGWPQWDVWLPPFFLVAAVFLTLNCWAAAGFMLGLGCMFKGQLLFVSPVLILAPLIAGWLGRFMRLVAGMATGAGLIVWPWLVTNQGAMVWIFRATSIAAFFCLLAVLTRGFLLREGRKLWNDASSDWPSYLRQVTLGCAALLCALIITIVLILARRRGVPPATVLLVAGIVLLPWFLPRRLIAGWILLVFASSIWLVGAYDGGSKTWYEIGFVYGTQRHQDMQLGANSLSNFSTILHEKYDWQLHDPIVNWNMPDVAGWLQRGGKLIYTPQELDVQTFCGLLFFCTVLICSVAAAVYLRRRDPKFLAVIVVPWIMFMALLTQMAARYTALGAVVSATLIGVSAEMSLLTFLQMVLACTMLGNQMLSMNNDTAPVALSITHPTYPDMAWLTVMVAAVFFFCAIVPSIRWRRKVEVV
jgi:hypothetical protein